MKTKFIFSIFSMVLLFSSCIKETEETNGSDTPAPELYMLYSGQDISADFFVRVVNEDDQALEGAIVSISGNQMITDENGVAILNDVSVDSDRAHVNASVTGYFTGHRNLNPSESDVNYVSIKVLPRVLLGTFNTSTGSTLTAGNGAEVSFVSGSLKTNSGDIYDGEVSVYSAYIDPASNTFGQEVPGDLIGMDGENPQVLESYGMFGIELESSTGEELDLGDGQEASLNFPVPTSLQGNAPSTIPLWSYNETDDVWEKDGEATLQSGVYTGNVSHFTWWNCDVPWDFVELEFSIEHGEEALPLSNANFALCLDGFTATGTTNSNGLFEGLVPLNETMTLKIYDPCGDLVWTDDIGPFAVDTDLGVISIPAVDIGYPMTGVAVDCNGDPITSGYAMLHEVGSTSVQTTLVDPDGTFTFPVICSTVAVDHELFIVDTGNGFTSDVTIVTYDPSGLNDLGDIDVCDAVLSEYFTAVYDGSTYDAFEELDMFYDASCFHINAYANPGGGGGTLNSLYTYLSIENVGGVGIVNECTPDSTGYFQLIDGGSQIFLNYESVTADITSYPTGIGEYLVGTYTADYSSNGGIPAGTITGSFSILND